MLNVRVLRRSRPHWWPFHDYAGMVQSLLPPCVPRIVADTHDTHNTHDSWFNPAVRNEILMLQTCRSTWSVLSTFRTDAFKKRINDLLAQTHHEETGGARHVCKSSSSVADSLEAAASAHHASGTSGVSGKSSSSAHSHVSPCGHA